MSEPLRVFIGWDSNEDIGYKVCEYSIRQRTRYPIVITPLRQSALRYIGLYRRSKYVEYGQQYDSIDGKPFSTEFSFTRFLVPALMQYDGWAVYCDCDFLWLEDICKLFDLFDDKYAVQVVKHNHIPREHEKMDGKLQSEYPRKNWSSLVLWNCAHRANAALSPAVVNTKPGRWLHGFEWLDDSEIGELPLAWNWLSGVSEPIETPKSVHFTLGGPWFVNCRDFPYADLWLREKELMIGGK